MGLAFGKLLTKGTTSLKCSTNFQLANEEKKTKDIWYIDKPSYMSFPNLYGIANIKGLVVVVV